MSLLIYCLVTLTLLLIGGALLVRKLRTLRRLLRRQEQHVWQTQNIFQLFHGEGPLPPAGGWAATTELLGELLRLVDERQPRCVVELGSGLSTLVLAAALRRNGAGRLICVENAEPYAGRTRAHLARLGLADWAEVRLAPLRDMELEGERRPWYDTAVLADLTGVELLFVDGPSTGPRADIRYPAVPFFWERLSAGAVVVLDDAQRPAEAAMVRDWQHRYPAASVELLRFEKGAARLTKPGG